IVPPGSIDRSPCGTGTCAQVATLFKNGRMNINETFTHESNTGSQFKAQLLKTEEKEGIIYNKVSITGSACLMARHESYMHDTDSMSEGYLLIPEIEGGTGI